MPFRIISADGVVPGRCLSISRLNENAAGQPRPYVTEVDTNDDGQLWEIINDGGILRIVSIKQEQRNDLGRRCLSHEDFSADESVCILDSLTDASERKWILDQAPNFEIPTDSDPTDNLPGTVFDPFDILEFDSSSDSGYLRTQSNPSMFLCYDSDAGQTPEPRLFRQPRTGARWYFEEV